MAAFQDFLDLAQRMSSTELNRSENDLSSNLKNALCEFGLFGVLDTSSGTNRAKRPDITLYSDLASADLGHSAEIVLEAKKPSEVASFGTLKEALSDDTLWNDKFIPYVSANAERIKYFLLTTFEKFIIVPIDRELRSGVVADGTYASLESRNSALENSFSFDLRSANGANDLEAWCTLHLTPEAFNPLPLSEITDLRVLNGSDDLELFASDLADIVVGLEGGGQSRISLVAGPALSAEVLDDLPPEVRRALVIYTMSAHGGMGPQDAETYLQSHLANELSDFQSASVHSLIGRLFAIKTIEDAFCVDVSPPLLPEEHWVFHSEKFDGLDSNELPIAFFTALQMLEEADNSAIKDLAATGRFYDWLAPQLDPIAFRRLIELFFSHNFCELDGDLLGRFFEIYSQRVDRRTRRELGQYYTPMPIVRYIWREAMAAVVEHDAVDDLIVLDPAVGSGSFLIEGVRHLVAENIEGFWEKLYGFDISPQVIGIAQVNFYLAVLGQLNRIEADAVGSLNLYPTDSLDPRNGAQLRSVLTLMTDESVRNFLLRRIELSEEVKQRSRFPVIIGNPPYKHNSTRTLAQMAEVFPALLRSTRDNARAQENTIREDYAWFFAAADHYLEGQGIIAFIVSDSFCYAPSFRYFRQDLLRRYKVRRLVHLGKFIFRDVGPRTSFVVIVLERRRRDLGSATDVEPIPYIDMRPAAIGNDAILGTQFDPRLLALDAGDIPEAVQHLPTGIRNFRLFPAGETVPVVLKAPVSLINDARRVFIKKWPGAVTGFDKLLKNRERAVVAQRMETLFEAASRSGATRAALLDELSQIIRANEAEALKLTVLADMISENQMVYSDSKITKTLSGSAPREAAWYPDDRMTNWVYFEPQFTFQRAIHEGKQQGWGTSNQWREPATHQINPKLVFTTSTNAAAGLKAFVVNDNWLVLKAAGTRQQLNYTGVVNPLAEMELGPNNLGGEALSFYEDLTSRGYDHEDFLHYISAIYNSELADDYLHDGGENFMTIPLDGNLLEISVVDRVIVNSRKMRDLTRLKIESSTGLVASQLAEALADRQTLAELGFAIEESSGGRFRQEQNYHKTEQSLSLLDARLEDIQLTINADVLSLFENLPDTD